MICTTLQTIEGWFHLHILFFPFVYKFYNRTVQGTLQNIQIHLTTNKHSWYLLLYPIEGSVPEIPSWSRVNNSKINLSTNTNGYLHFTVLLWKVTLWYATSCFSVDTPVYRIINYPEDNKPMPFSWFKGPHVADIKSVVFWSSSSTHVVILRRWQSHEIYL